MNKIEELTKNKFDQIEHGQIFAEGVLPNSPEGIFMTRDGGKLRWITKKGYGNDWAIYCHWDYNSIEWIEKHGDKIHNESHIKLCIPCTNEVFKLY